MSPVITPPAPGARVVIRDEEWMVRSVNGATVGGYSIRVVGVSELVEGKEAIFLTALDEIVELRPEETELVQDDSPNYRRSRLYLDALLRRSPATDDALYVGHRGAILPTQYQLQPAAKALRQLRPRILMADSVGLGKTIEVGILLSELIQRGRGDRILVVALKSVLAQFQKELWARFTIPLVRLDSVGIQRVQSKIPSNMNPFYYFDRVIISIDTLKRDEKYRRFLEHCRWDAVVVDECQHVAIRGQRSQRARLAQLLGRTTESLILTSATPHDGRPESFASLINLLEPTAIADIHDYTSDEVSDLFIRRFKKDVAHEVEEEFPKRSIELKKVPASNAEDRVLDLLSRVEFRTIGRQRGTGVLFRTLLLKAFLSSPAACISTIAKRLEHKDMQDGDDPDVQYDREVLEELRDACLAVSPEQFTKCAQLLEMLRCLGFDRKKNTERIVIFSERIDTLRFLQELLEGELGLGDKQIQQFHGTLKDVDQTDLVESFGAEESPVRILLASDAASEGINLHYHCHLMVHFDLPWSLITVEQRNGRIDRFGQTDEPQITYLLTVPTDTALQGDLRVLEVLIEKEDAAYKNLGDVAWLMNLHHAQLEEERIAQGIEKHEPAEEIIPEAEEPVDFMSILFGSDAPSEEKPEVKTPLRLLGNELEYARDAFREVLGHSDEHLEWHEHLDGFSLRPTDDLERRFEYLPPELRAGSKELKLTTDRARVMKSLEEARQEEKKWPEWQLFWEQHPVAEWLDDRVLAKIARHQAPVLRLHAGIEPDERVFVFQGVVTNQRGQPAIIEWLAVRFRGEEPPEVSSLDKLVAATGLDESVPNPGGSLADAVKQELDGLRDPAVRAAHDHMIEVRKQRAADIAGPIKDGLTRLNAWREKRVGHLNQLEMEWSSAEGTMRKDRRRRLDDEHHEMQKLQRDRRHWIEGMRTAEQPYLRLAAVLVSQEGS